MTPPAHLQPPRPPAADGPADARSAARWPYPARAYVKRAAWWVVWRLVWRMLPFRTRVVRPLLLRAFGGRVAAPFVAAPSSWIELPWAVDIGRYASLGARSTLYNLGGVRVGEYTFISQDVYVCGGTHDYRDPAFPLVRTPITIGRHVWIAAGAFIGPGVTVGDGAVVGARAVVTRDVEPWTVVAGNPAQVIGRREPFDIGSTSAPAGDPAARGGKPEPGTSGSD